MGKNYKLFIVVFAVIASLSIIFVYNNKKNSANSDETYLYNGSKNIECLYYNKTDFMNIKNYALKQESGTIHGCIVPHHLVAKDLIHEVFQNVSKNRYKTVVLIGPDHESINKGKIFTTLKDWQTPTGILKTDEEITGELLKNSFVEENDEKLTIEHSTSGIIPFIKYYLGDVRVITLVLTKQVKLEDIDEVVEQLYENVNLDETLFIASVDFSHYLSLNLANEMDLVSKDAIMNKDINKIMTFTNDNLDSPVSVAAMIKMMEKANANNCCVLNHSNSELILKKRIEETTSYITFLFY